MFKTAITDMAKGFSQHYLWMMLGNMDIKLRYRRSTLGPFWVTISTAVTIAIMSMLFSQVLKQPLNEYIPYIGFSMAIWFYITSAINSSCYIFIASKDSIIDISLPLSTYVLKICWRDFLILCHNFVIIAVIILAFHLFYPSLIFFPFMLFFVLLFFYFFAMINGMLCARFRDLISIITMMTQVLMFITPVFWQKDFMTKYTWVVFMNPFYHLLELLRAPLLNKPFPMESFIVVICMNIVLFFIACFFIGKYKYRLPYWVA